MELWCPFAGHDPIPRFEGGAGPMQGGAPKILHHTTEGSSFGGAHATYANTGNLPHFTDTFEQGSYHSTSEPRRWSTRGVSPTPTM